LWGWRADVFRHLRFFILASLTLHAAGSAVHGAVDLAWVDNDGTSSGWLGAKGATFQLTLNISSSEATTGLDYYLTTPDGFVGGLPYFTLNATTGRDITGSSYSDTYFTNTQVQTAPANTLNPQSDLDLGGTINNVNNANVPGTYLVAKYTFVVNAATPFGTYTIQTTSNPGTGWIGAAPNFDENPFNHHASYSITIAAPQWNRDTGGSWGTNTNWSDNIIPSLNTATANFLDRIIIPSTVTMDASRTLNVMNIDSPIAYTIARGGGSGILSMAGTAPSVNVLNGNHTISTFITYTTVGSFNVSSGASVLMSGTLNWSVNGSYNIATGASATVSGNQTTGASRTVSKVGGGTLTLTGTQSPAAGAVFIANAGQTNMNAVNGTAATALVAASSNLTLTVNGTGSVDLGADQFLRGLNILFTDPGLQSLDLNSPATAGAFRSVRIYATDLVAAQAALYGAITNAQTNPGDGLFDSGMAAHPGSRLAVIKRPDLHNDLNLQLRLATTGDLNLDGSVTISDFIDLAASFGTTGANWANGDLNYDGEVSISDFIDLSANFGATYTGEVFPISPEDSAKLAEFAAAHGVSVPEPGLIGLAAAGILVLSRRRPRNHS
jgi:hypothetical protein